MSMMGSDLYTCSANGWIKVLFSHTFISVNSITGSAGRGRLTAPLLGKHTKASFSRP